MERLYRKGIRKKYTKIKDIDRQETHITKKLFIT